MMTSKIKASISSMRLRTLPLSLSGVILGTMLAVPDFRVNPGVIVFILLTTVCLQILSNLSNELGDVIHGTDTADRQGPQYGMDQGVLTVKDMKALIALFVVLSCIFGLLMIYLSFGTFMCIESVNLVLLGAAAIFGAIRYTLGKNPYGYRGLGDFSVFLFFGIVSVLGSYFVAAHTISSWFLLLPAGAIGCFSVAVLNVNNIRDMKTDAPNRVTVAIKLGETNAKIYQTALIVVGWACMIAFSLCRFPYVWHYLYVLTLPLYVMHVNGVWKRHDRDLDPMLPMLVLSTFLFAFLAGLGFDLFLF